ncbi:MerC domain-containing protein [Bdellovibrio sp. HCB288]|uniref:MerC domain-containing protein n=1 Tax=Bdellovibrio sp. HCB288 TaxID=3394355 RepID=UPI0039B4561B
MEKQPFGQKPVFKSVEPVASGELSFSMNPSMAGEACCDVDHTQHEQFAEQTDIWDRLGIYLSSLCAIHCLLTPVFLLALPALGEVFESTWVHMSMAAFILPIGLFAFWSGYKHHRQMKVVSMGVGGLLLVCIGTLMHHELEEILPQLPHNTVTILGSVLLVTAHFLNRKACQCDSHSK